MNDDERYAETEYRIPDPWKVRWCGKCRRYEYDAGIPRGWVTLMGDPPGRDPRLAKLLDIRKG